MDAVDAGRWWTRTQWTQGRRPLEHCGRWTSLDVDDRSGLWAQLGTSADADVRIQRTQIAGRGRRSGLGVSVVDAALDAVGRWWTQVRTMGVDVLRPDADEENREIF